MNFKSIAALFVTILFLVNTTSAMAQIAEVRFGISEFDERTLDIGIAAQRATENSVALNFEVLFEEPDFLKWALSPQPYIGGTLNLEGKTSYGGAGLLWRQKIGEKFYGDFAFGLVAHTGTNDIQLSRPITAAQLMTVEGQQRAADFFNRFNSEIQFGSTILFREQIALGYNVSDTWSGEVFFEHLSNGYILSSKDNHGADTIGFRAVRKF